MRMFMRISLIITFLLSFSRIVADESMLGTPPFSRAIRTADAVVVAAPEKYEDTRINLLWKARYKIVEVLTGDQVYLAKTIDVYVQESESIKSNNDSKCILFLNLTDGALVNNADRTIFLKERYPEFLKDFKTFIELRKSIQKQKSLFYAFARSKIFSTNDVDFKVAIS